MFNLLLPTLSTFIAILITVPISRRMCFPPQKLALIDHATSGNAPAAPGHGEKISSDSATGAPEAQKGEAAEQEASSFVNGLGTIAVALGTGTGVLLIYAFLQSILIIILRARRPFRERGRKEQI